jgi:hypothetical protein
MFGSGHKRDEVVVRIRRNGAGATAISDHLHPLIYVAASLCGITDMITATDSLHHLYP